MASNKFSDGLTKTAGVLGAITKAVTKASGGPLNAILTASDALNQGKQNWNKATAMQTARGNLT